MAQLINNIFHLGDGADRVGVRLAIDQGGATLVHNDFIPLPTPTGWCRIQDGLTCVMPLEAVNDCAAWQGCDATEGNIGVPPGWINPPADYHLSPLSPLIDQGADPDLWLDDPVVPLDFDGDERPVGEAPDIGPDEAPAPDPPPEPNP